MCLNHRMVMLSSETFTDSKYNWQEGNVLFTLYTFCCPACKEIRELKSKE